MNESEQERRKSSRYAPARPEVWVGWEGPNGFQSARVQIVNISFGGIALLDDIPVPQGTPLWIKLVEEERIPWASVAIAGRAEHESGTPVVRLQFLDDCPYDFYRSAVFGFDHEEVAEPPPAPAVELPMRPADPVTPPLPDAPPMSADADPWSGAARPVELAPAAVGLREAFTRQRRFDRGFNRPFAPSRQGHE